MQKIKLFLAAYINFSNAQNVNCEHIARYIDKDKFEVHAMYTHKLPVDRAKYEAMGIHLHKLIHHRFIWYWSKLWHMWRANCDIYYMPKSEKMDKVFAKWYKGKKVFCASIEVVVTDTTNNSPDQVEYFTKTMDAMFAISNCIGESVQEKWHTTIPVIPLGVDPPECDKSIREKIRRVVWVGNVKANKRPQYLLDVAKSFPSVDFLMIGDGDMMDTIKDRIRDEHIENVKMLGRIPNEEVYTHLRNSDVLLMTSEYEGLPKVIQEAALCKLPSIYMAQNYKVDFIMSGKNGYEAYSVEQMKEQLQTLIDKPELYKSMAEEAYQSIQPYLWPKLIKQYEEYFQSLVDEAK